MLDIEKDLKDLIENYKIKVKKTKNINKKIKYLTAIVELKRTLFNIQDKYGK